MQIPASSGSRWKAWKNIFAITFGGIIVSVVSFWIARIGCK